jgi:fumarate hydratase class II
LIESIQFTANVINALTDKCIIGISADRARCQAMVEQSLAMVTALAPAIGYEKAAKLVQRAMASGQTIRELAQQEKVLGDDELAKILDPWRMTQPGIED